MAFVQGEHHLVIELLTLDRAMIICIVNIAEYSVFSYI